MVGETAVLDDPGVPSRVGDGLVDRVAGGEEHGALRVAVVVGEGYELDREPEEPGESDRVDVRSHRLEVAPEDLRSDVDAEHRLGSWRVGGRRRGRPRQGQITDQSTLFGAVEGVL